MRAKEDLLEFSQESFIETYGNVHKPKHHTKGRLLFLRDYIYYGFYAVNAVYLFSNARCVSYYI